MKLSRYFPAALAAALLALAPAAAAETTLQRIERTGAVRVGYANEAPFAYTLPDGSLSGESPAIVKAVFARLGANRVEPVLAEWGGLIPGLLAGRYDLIAAGMFITPERAQAVLFSNPHYRIGDTLLVVRSNPRRLRSYGDLAADRRLKLAVLAGSVEADYALQAGVSEGQLLQVPTSMAQLQAVRTGRAAAAAGTELSMRALAARDPARVEALGLFIDDPRHTGYGALAFRPDDGALRDAVNAVLKDWIGSAEHLRAVAPFGFTRINLTDRTAEQVIGAAAPR